MILFIVSHSTKKVKFICVVCQYNKQFRLSRLLFKLGCAMTKSNLSSDGEEEIE